MKTVRIFAVALFAIVLTTNVSAQSSTTLRGEAVEKPINKKKAWPDDKKLKSYFTSGAIPSGFPKHDEASTKEENKAKVMAWASVAENYALLSEAGQEKFKTLSSKK